MKQDILRNIKWMAWSWHVWDLMARDSPIVWQYRKEAQKEWMNLILACAEFNVWYAGERRRCCQSCDDIDGGKV